MESRLPKYNDLPFSYNILHTPNEKVKFEDNTKRDFPLSTKR